MKISKWKFEQELDSLINAALSTSNKETARGYLNEAESKINGYYNIDYNLRIQYRAKIQNAREKLDL